MSVPDSILRSIREGMDLSGDPANHRVVVAMSGGVDSSVAAGLLHAAGYEVVGVTLQLYDHGQATGRKRACCAGQDVHDARRVAAKLGIPHYVLDFEGRFRSAVIDAFADSYLKGETPVPCVTCNQTVKFADLLERSRDLGAAALATGHYIRSRARAGRGGERDLVTPADMARDQSYFLFGTTQAQANFLRFPLGELTKDETRSLAAAMDLDIAAKPDSQDICFVPQGRYQDLVAKLRPEASRGGDIVHIDGRRLGRHEGIIHFTVGQRRGLKHAEGEPLYVVRIDSAARRVMVGPKSALACARFAVRAVNWLGSADEAATLFVKIRSSRTPVPARVLRKGSRVQVVLSEPEYGVSPGQACVFYDAPGAGARLLGGGTIVADEEHEGVAVAVNPVVNRLESPVPVTI